MASIDSLLQHADFVRDLARSLVRDAHEADDVVQQTWLAALRRPPRAPGSRRGWLATVVRHAAFRSRRSRGRRDRHEQAAARPDGTAGSPLDALVLRSVTEAVLALPPLYRDAVLMRFYEGLPPRAIAARLEVPVATVRSRLQRALAQLRERLDDAHEGNRAAWCVPLLAFAHPPRPLTGALLMGIKTKLAAVVVLAGLAAVWTLWPRSDRDEVARRAAHPAVPAPARTEGAGPAPDDSAPAPAAIDRQRDLHGTVVRASDGAPVAGARLRALGTKRFDLFFAERRAEELATAVSGADGGFRLSLAPGQLVTLEASAEGYAPVSLAPYQAGERVRVALDPPAAVSVVVRDPQGRPVAGVPVSFRGERSRARGVTGADGRVRLDDLAAEDHGRLEAEPRDYGEWAAEISVPHEREIVLSRGRTLRGTVRDAATGAPLAGARVGFGWGYFLGNEVRTDEHGAYVLHGWLGEGAEEIQAESDTHARVKETVGDRTVIDFELPLGDVAVGRVVDADGNPVAGARLSARGMIGVTSFSALSIRSGATGPDGRFLLAGLGREMPHTLVVVAAGHGRLHRDFAPHPEVAGTIDLGDLVLPVARTLAGRVVDAQGNPVPRVPLRLEGRMAGYEPLGSPFARYGDTESRRTDDLGRFRFVDLPPGTYWLTARPEKRQETRVEATLPAARDVDDLVVTLADDETFLVRVTDEEGVPLAGMSVTVLTDSAGVMGETDARGEARLAFRGRVVRVSASSFGGAYLDRHVEPEPDARTAHLVLERGALVSGHAFDENGRPLVQTDLEAWHEDGSWAGSGTSNQDGAFSIRVRAGATVTLRASNRPERGQGFVGELTGVAAGQTGVELRVTRVPFDRTLRVKVVRPGGEPAAGAKVYVSDRWRPQAAGEDGVVTWTQLPARAVEVSAHLDDPRLTVARATVVPDGQEVTLTLPVAVEVTGVVVTADGAPVEGARIEVWEGERHLYAAVSDAAGRFTARVADAGPPLTLVIDGTKVRVEDVKRGATGLRLVVR